MKAFLRTIVVSILVKMARDILRKYQPTVLMVTGSVGKSSTKDAIAAALASTFYLRASKKSYNSEFGLPLTVIGKDTAWGNPLGWLKIILEGFSLLIFPSHYPRLLVLEVGADRPGDLEKILKIATPHAVVVTRLPEIPVHVEAYADPEGVREEEFAPAYALPHGAPLILSADDEYARALATRVHSSNMLYGYGEDAAVRIVNARYEEGGMRADIEVEGKRYPIASPSVIGRQQLYAPAAAVAIALRMGLTVETALEGLAEYLPPPGRSAVLEGKKGSMIIDDTYNSSPAAVEEALGSFELLPVKGRRIAVLGDMLELGRYSVGEHERIGRLAARKVDLLVTVGPRANAMHTAALASGMPPEKTLSYGSSTEAAEVLAELVEENDIILIKGSQGVRMERITQLLLADPRDAEKLARQDGEWKKR